MSPETRALKIASYGAACQTLIDGLKAFPVEMWDFRDEHGCWSIRERLVHVADSEANSYIRCRRFIAEPGQPLMAYDENGWAASLGYEDRDPAESIELFRLLRQQTHDLIKPCPNPPGPTPATTPRTGT